VVAAREGLRLPQTWAPSTVSDGHLEWAPEGMKYSLVSRE